MIIPARLAAKAAYSNCFVAFALQKAGLMLIIPANSSLNELIYGHPDHFKGTYRISPAVLLVAVKVRSAFPLADVFSNRGKKGALRTAEKLLLIVGSFRI